MFSVTYMRFALMGNRICTSLVCLAHDSKGEILSANRFHLCRVSHRLGGWKATGIVCSQPSFE
jgi:hypothetical protein